MLSAATGAQEALDQLRNVDYEIFTETLAHTVFGWSEGDAAHRVADVHAREPDRRSRATLLGVEPGAWTSPTCSPKVTQPTLVLHRRDFPLLSLEVAKNLAATIPDAHLKVLEGASLSPYMGDMRAVLDAISEFTGVDATRAPARAPGACARGEVAAARRPAGARQRGFRTIMFTDMEGSTALTQRLGDAEAQELVRLHNAIVGEALAAHGGSQVKHTGDGIMASFLTASAAVECAITIQRALDRHNDASPARARSWCASASTPASPWPRATTCSARRCSSRRASARAPSPARSWRRMSCASWSRARASSSPTGARRSSAASRIPCACTRCAGARASA